MQALEEKESSSEQQQQPPQPVRDRLEEKEAAMNESSQSTTQLCVVQVNRRHIVWLYDRCDR